MTTAEEARAAVQVPPESFPWQLPPSFAPSPQSR